MNFTRCIYPHSILSVKVNEKVVSPDLVNKVIAFLCIYMLLIVAEAWLVQPAACHWSIRFSPHFRASRTPGLGAGVTGYGNSYDILPDAAKWILSLLMLIGRLEIFTVLVLLTPAFWRR